VYPHIKHIVGHFTPHGAILPTKMDLTFLTPVTYFISQILLYIAYFVAKIIGNTLEQEKKRKSQLKKLEKSKTKSWPYSPGLPYERLLPLIVYKRTRHRLIVYQGHKRTKITQK